MVSFCLMGSLKKHFMRPWVPSDYSTLPWINE